MYMKTFLVILQTRLKKDYADLNVHFYLSRRSKFVHMGLDLPLNKIGHTEEILETIENFWSEKKTDDKFKYVYPHLIYSMKWKFDYIIFEKNYDH